MSIEFESLAEKYLKNQCTPEEAKLVLNWFDTPQGLQFLQKNLSDDAQLLANNNLFISPSNVYGDVMFNAILKGIQQEDKPAVPVVKEQAKIIESGFKPGAGLQRKLRLWYKVAALFIGVSLISLLGYKYLLTGNDIIRSTQFGETARILLPDGSSVILNGNSSIEYSGKWGDTEARQVELKGEAFFAIKHTTNHQKFIVKTADTIQVEVLGTEFYVSERKRKTQVVLVSGKIRLDMRGGHTKMVSVMMKPGETVDIMAKSNIIHKHKVDAAVITSWTGNKLVFDNTSVRDICNQLKDTYGYQVTVTDQKIMDQHITGSVPNENIELVLEGLEAILNVKFTKTPSK